MVQKRTDISKRYRRTCSWLLMITSKYLNIPVTGVLLSKDVRIDTLATLVDQLVCLSIGWETSSMLRLSRL
jgi:hypothetical protein